MILNDVNNNVATLNVALDVCALEPGFKAHEGRGIGRYVKELSRYFEENTDPAVHVSTFSSGSSLKGGVLQSAINLLPAGRETVRQQIVYPLRLQFGLENKASLLHFPAHMDAPSWSLKNYVITVLDLIPLVLSDLYKADKPSWRFRFARWLEIRAIKNASFIIAISEHTANDVVNVLGIPREKIAVTHLGVDELFFKEPEEEAVARVKSTFGVDGKHPLLMYVGGIDQRKNWKGLLHSFSDVVARYREQKAPAPRLMMAGKIQKDLQFPKLMALIKELSLDENVILPGYVSDQDLRALFSLASLFVFPSLYEGFGLPPLEAMAGGLPVVSSNRSCLPEIVGDSALLVDPTDRKGFSTAILEVLENKSLRETLREKGIKRAREFTWERTGALTLDAYRAAANYIDLDIPCAIDF